MFRVKHFVFELVFTLAIWMYLAGFAAAAITQVDSRWDPNTEPILGGPATTGCNSEPGTRPLPIRIPPGMASIIIQNTSGAMVDHRQVEPVGPEGIDRGRVVHYESAPGLSGIVSRRKYFLAGVLTADLRPTGNEPSDRDGDLDMASDRLSNVELYQIFGIGRREIPRVLEIVLPAGAEWLWLFAIDTCIGRGARLGGYAGNMGTWQVEYELLEQAAPVTTLVSVGIQDTPSNGPSFEPSISGDGRFVAFVSAADNLVPDDTNEVWDIFVFDRQTAQTTRVSVSSGGLQGNSDSFNPVMSGDGRYVVFESDADNLVAGDTNEMGDIFVHDLQTRQTKRVNVNSTGAEANDISQAPAINADGRVVVFASWADNLVAGDTNGQQDVFAHEMGTGRTSRVSIDFEGQQIEEESSAPAMSSDGRYIAFQTFLGGENSDILIYDGNTRQVTRLTQETILGGAGKPAMSGNGQVVTFIEEANLFLSVYDRLTAQIQIISTDENEGASISAVGRFVAFNPADESFKSDVFVYDRQTSSTTLISVDKDGNPSDSASFSPAISSQGRFVAFASNSDNLVPADNNASTDVFVYDRGR